MSYRYNDGGREAAGFKGNAGDCVTRSIAIATGKPYQEVYDALWSENKAYAGKHRDRVAKRISERGSTPHDGVRREIYESYLKSIGWRWEPLMKIGSGCTVHLRADELPDGNIIARCSRHLVAVIDGAIHDTFDPSRGGTRCVYGYFIKN